MASLSMNNKTKKNELSKINYSNKDILIKKDYNKNATIYNYNLQEKISSKKNLLFPNTSVKKIKQVKKISINDYDNNQSKKIIKNNSLKNKTKLDISNKENHILNIKDKKDTGKIVQKKLLNNIADMKPKIKVSKKTKQIMKKNKFSKSEKYIDNYNKKNKVEHINNNNTTNNNTKKNSKDNNINRAINIKKDESGEITANTLHSEDIGYIYRHESKILSEQYSTGGNFRTLIPLIKMKKQHLHYSFKRQSTTNNIKKRKLMYNNGYFNSTYLKRYNSNNNGIENSKSYIDIINNLDIINIINKKEETKRLSASTQNFSCLNRTQDLSKRRKKSILKKNNTSKNVNISTQDNRDYKDLEINEKNKKKLPSTLRETNPSNENKSILNTEKKNNYDKTNNNNKWGKRYFIPIVSASLINGEDKIKTKPSLIRRIKKKKKEENENVYLLKTFSSNNRKSINFGDNNKKKREMLFNYINEKIENEKNNYISFQSKRTNSFTLKRDKHITERNNSIHNMRNNDSYLMDDLIQQEKKLELIRNEIGKEKEKLNKTINKNNKFCISMDNICNKAIKKKSDKNNTQQDNNNIIIIHGNKKFKTFHIKINSLKKNKDSNINNKNNNSMIIKRGDLLNKLRKIKHDYSLMIEQ